MSTSRSSRSAPNSAHPTRQQLDELDALLQRMLELPVNKLEDVPTASPVEPAIVPQQRAPVKPAPEPEKDVRAILPIAAKAPEPPATTRLPVQPPHLHRQRTPPPREEPDEAEEQAPPANGQAETQDKQEDWIPLRASWKPSPHTWGPLAECWHQAQQAASERPIVRLDPPMSAPPEPEPEPEAPALPTIAEEAEAPPSVAPDTHVEESQETLPPETIVYPRPEFSFVDPDTRTTQVSAKPATSVSSPPEPASEARRTPWTLRPLVWINCVFSACLILMGPPGRWFTGPAGRSLLGVVGIVCLVGAVGLVVADWLGWTW